MAEHKDYGLIGVGRNLQFGKQGPILVGNADTDTFTVTMQDAATLTTMGGANATEVEHFITKGQLDVVYTEATFKANVNYNDSSPILLGNITAGTKTIITTLTIGTAFDDANAAVTIGTSANNSLLMSDDYCEIENTGVYQTINVLEINSNTSLNIYVTQAAATAGAGNVLVSVVDGPVVDGGTINYGTGGNSPTNTITNTDGYNNFHVTVEANGLISMNTARGGLEIGAMPEIGAPQHLHIMRPAGQGSTTDLYFGDDYNYIRMPGLYGSGTQGVDIGSSYNNGTVHVWRFDTDGNLKLPAGGGIVDSTGNSVLGAGGGITLANLSVAIAVNPSGNGSLSYNNTTGVFTFTPANLSSVAGNYGNSNVVTLLSSFGNNAISTTGNISGARLSVTSSATATSITLTGSGTAVNASSGNMLTNRVTGTEFAFLNGIYTASLTGGGATSNYTLKLPANVGSNGQVLTTDGTGNLIWTTSSSYGNSNVATLLSSFGSNTISTTGNISVGNVSATGVIVNGQLTTYGVVNGSYLFAVNNADQTSIGQNGAVNFQTTSASNGSLITKTSNSQVTLTAGYTYKLKAVIGRLASSSTWAQFRWYDVTNGAYVGAEGFSEVVNSSGAIGSTNVPTAYVTPNVNTTYELRQTTGNTVTVNAYASMEVTQVNPTIAVQATATGTINTSYAKYTRSAQQTGATSNTVIICNVLENTNGSSISVNTSNGQITLTAGKTYRLRGGVPGWGASNGSRPAFMWYNETGSTWIGQASQTYNAGDAASFGATGGSAEAVFTANATTVVSFRVLSASQTLALGANGDWSTTGSYPWIDIQEITSSFALNTIDTLTTTGKIIVGNVTYSNVTGTDGQVLTVYANGVTYWSTVTSGSNYGNSNVATLLSSFGSNTITTTGNISGSNISATGTTVTGIAAITAGVTNTLLPNTVASFSANVNNYTQVTLQNKSSGADATADFVITANNGSDTVNYADFGIINSGYDNTTPTNSLGNIVFAADTYLYAQGNASATSQSGGNIAIGTTVTGKTVKIFAGGANSTAIVGTFSNTGLAVNGNVTANNFSGNISITGNVTGTSPNVTLVAGAYSATMDNAGFFSAPTLKSTNASGNEGGEVHLTLSPNATISGSVIIDSYVDRLRIFEGGGTARGAYIDLTQAAAGVGTLLNNRVSGIVNAGTFVTMDLIKATVTTTGNRGLSLAATTGSFGVFIAGNYATASGANGSAGSTTITTSASASQFNWNFSGAGDIATFIITDTSNSRAYRITMQIGSAYNNNLIVIERLV